MSNIAARKEIQDRESGQPVMHERKKGTVTAAQAVGIRVMGRGCFFWVEGGLIRRLNLDLTLAKHQPNPFASEYLSNLHSPIILSTSSVSMLTTLL